MPMWSSVANLKESLSKIALDVHDEDDDDDELSIYTPPPSHDRFNNENSVPERRLSRRSNTPTHSPIVNGFNSPANHEIEQYKIEIRRLQDSEAEIKALSVNYAALLKEKEDQISRLSEENGTLKQNLLTTNDALSASKTALKGSGDLSPIRHNRAAVKTRSAGSIQTNGFAQKHDRLSNGSTSAKELSEMTEDEDGPFAVMQATYESQVKQMMMELDKERGKLSNVHVRLQDEQKLNASLQQELHSLKDDNGRMLKEMQKTRDELNQKISGIGRLQVELQRRDTEENNDTVEKLKKVISTLENENSNIKKEKDELEAALTAVRSSPAHKHGHVDLNTPNEHASTLNEAFPGKEEMQQSLQKLEKDLNETLQAKDKALLELTRLKQHLLEKASEESEKMDEDSKIIEELRETIEHQRFQISRLEQALKLAIRDQDETKLSNNNELKKAKEIIDELNRKLMSCKNTIDAKNMEVLNLQTALGQYYAEIEAKERLGEELSVAKEESTRLSKQLKEAHQQTEASAREKEEILEKLSQAESLLVEGKNRVKKLEEDNEKLRRALDQSMNRLNRMSVDSDFLVDRRIVIKLLVTYFQRNHSKEVLELMARMLGFSDEDKKRIGVAQQGTGKGVVRGVFGLPGRLVGGILGSGTAGVPSTMASDNQSFADLWVDFLLTETEREKREAMEAASSGSNQDQHKASPNAAGAASPLPNYTNTNTSRPNSSPLSSHGNFLHREHSESEFSTVPLSSSGSGSQNYRQLPRY